MSHPTQEQLQQAWVELQDIHKRYLSVHEVQIPKAKHYSDNNKAIWLAILWHYRDREVHKNEVSEIVKRDSKKAAADQQVRHLKRDGWDIGPRKGWHKLSPYNPSPEFRNTSAQKRMRLAATDFEGVKPAFGFKCATCGAMEGEPDPRYGIDPVILQQGHMNPNEAGNSLDNIIPQCQYCNRTYRNDFVFDGKGRVHAVASIEPVRRASKHVRQDIFNWLSKNLR